MSQGVHLRKYGAAATIDFQLFDTDGVDMNVAAAHASGDTKIMKDEGAEANTTNGFSDEGQGYSIVLTATEMQAARIVVYVVDQSTKAWLDTALVIETYGNASAMHAFDLDSAGVDVTSINGNAASAVRQALAAGQMIPGTVDNTAHTPTATEFEADDITEATADHFGGLTNNGRLVLWTTGALTSQVAPITDYVLTGGRGHFTVEAMTEAPANNDTFIII